MNGFKNVFTSKAILTSIVGAIFALLSLTGLVDVSAETQAAVVTVLFTLAGIFRFTATEQLVLGSAT